MLFKIISFTAIMLSNSVSIAIGEEIGDPDAGKRVFAKCKACHVVDSAANKIGPSLLGVVGRVPGTVEGFKYSKAMIVYGEDKVWDEDNLAAYLRAPRAIVKGTRMAFVGLKKDEDITNIIAYIKQFEE